MATGRGGFWRGGLSRGAGLAALALAAIAALWFGFGRETPAPRPVEGVALAPSSEAPAPPPPSGPAEPARSEPETTEAAPADAAPAVAGDETEPAATVLEPETAEPAAEPGTRAEPAAEPAPPQAAPTLDIVRVEPDGAGIVAGRAEPRAEVEILVGGEVVGAARAGDDGGFAALVRIDPDAGASAVTARAAPSPPVVAPDAAPSAAPPAPPAAPLASEPVLVLPAEAEGAAPVVVRPTVAGVEILQPASRPEGVVSLDVIDYDGTGRVSFSGRATPGAEVRLYLDEAPLGVAAADDAGRWRWETGGVAAGSYRLRLDEVTPEGVASRIETPFLRETAERAASAPGALTVQRGDSLWRIAASVYGEGLRYTLIYGANRDAIRDPDLIYPGQIFSLPAPPQ